MSSGSVQANNVKHENYLAQLRRQQSQELRDSKTEHEQQVEKVSSDHAKTMREKERAYKLELESMESRFQEEMESLQLRYGARLEQAKLEGERSIADVKEAITRQKLEIQTNNERTVNKMREDFVEEQTRLEKEAANG